MNATTTTGFDRIAELKLEYIEMLKAFNEGTAEPDADLRTEAIRRRLALDHGGRDLEGDIGAYKLLHGATQRAETAAAALDGIDPVVEGYRDAKRRAATLRAEASAIESDDLSGVESAHRAAMAIGHERDSINAAFHRCTVLTIEHQRMNEAGTARPWKELTELRAGRLVLVSLTLDSGQIRPLTATSKIGKRLQIKHLRINGRRYEWPALTTELRSRDGQFNARLPTRSPTDHK